MTFTDHLSAERAVAELNARELNGRAVHVRLDRDVVDTTHNIFVGNLPWLLTSAELYTMFQSFRPVECQVLTNMYGKSRGFAIVKFASEGDAARAIAALHNVEVSGRNIEVSPLKITTAVTSFRRFSLVVFCFESNGVVVRTGTTLADL